MCRAEARRYWVRHSFAGLETGCYNVRDMPSRRGFGGGTEQRGARAVLTVNVSARIKEHLLGARGEDRLSQAPAARSFGT